MYQVTYHCNNCGHTFEKDITKGRKAPDIVACHRCDCNTAKKVLRGTATTWYNGKKPWTWPWYASGLSLDEVESYLSESFREALVV